MANTPRPFYASPEVEQLLGDQELDILTRMATAEPYNCIVCGKEGTAPADATVVVVVHTRKPEQADGDLFLVRLAHASCSASEIVVNPDAAMNPAAHGSVQVSAAVLGSKTGRNASRAVLFVDFPVALSSANPADRSDLLINGMLKDGLSLVTDLGTVPAPAPGFRVTTNRRTLDIWGADGEAIASDVDLAVPPGWEQAAKASGNVTVIIGSSLHLEHGTDGLQAALQAGRLAGGLVAVTFT